MENYKKVKMWATTVNLDKAIEELTNFRAKYPYYKLDETSKALLKLSSDLPKIINMITHQEKQNAMHREYIRVSRIADEAIVTGIASKFKINISEDNG